MSKKKLIELARQMRREPTRSEAMLWGVLRNRNLKGVKFRRQQVIDRFILDYFAPSLKLVIEIDGAVHNGREDWDAAREDFLRDCGLNVVRFSASDVENNLDWVLKKLEDTIAGFCSLTP
jgi:very-short-patch-repair endonuclease